MVEDCKQQTPSPPLPFTLFKALMCLLDEDGLINVSNKAHIRHVFVGYESTSIHPYPSTTVCATLLKQFQINFVDVLLHPLKSWSPRIDMDNSMESG